MATSYKFTGSFDLQGPNGIYLIIQVPTFVVKIANYNRALKCANSVVETLAKAVTEGLPGYEVSNITTALLQ